MIKQDSGFSLVELMVTIVIMAILAAIGATLFSTVTSLARDAQRMKDLETIKQALELYRSDVHNYPAALSFGNKLESPTSVYLSKVPNDSKSGQTYLYQPSPSGCGVAPQPVCSGFILCAKKEGVETSYDVPSTHLCYNNDCGGSGVKCNIGISSQ